MYNKVIGPLDRKSHGLLNVLSAVNSLYTLFVSIIIVIMISQLYTCSNRADARWRLESWNIIGPFAQKSKNTFK